MVNMDSQNHRGLRKTSRYGDLAELIDCRRQELPGSLKYRPQRAGYCASAESELSDWAVMLLLASQPLVAAVRNMPEKKASRIRIAAYRSFFMCGLNFIVRLNVSIQTMVGRSAGSPAALQEVSRTIRRQGRILGRRQ